MDGGTPTELVTRIRNLHLAASRDYDSQLWSSWERHLKSYNRLFREAGQLVPELEVESIAPVPVSRRGPPASPSASEQDKLSEIVNAIRALLDELLYRFPGSKGTPSLGMAVSAEPGIEEMKSRQVRTVIERFGSKSERRPTLNYDDVVVLVDFIEQYTRQFESTPKSYNKMSEEQLRDLLVGMMNAEYPGNTTAETFSKLGKTDISLRVDSGHVLVCECKLWSGGKAYGHALDQLFNYLTWRQNYGVLLHFCKLRGMTTAVSEAQRAMTGHTSFREGTLCCQSDTRFTTRHLHPQDHNRSVEVFHLFVDLYVMLRPLRNRALRGRQT